MGGKIFALYVKSVSHRSKDRSSQAGLQRAGAILEDGRGDSCIGAHDGYLPHFGAKLWRGRPGLLGAAALLVATVVSFFSLSGLIWLVKSAVYDAASKVSQWLHAPVSAHLKQFLVKARLRQAHGLEAFLEHLAKAGRAAKPDI